MLALTIRWFMTQWCENKITKFFKQYIFNGSFYFPKRVTSDLPKIVGAVMKIITQGLHDYFIVHLLFSHGSWLCSCSRRKTTFSKLKIFSISSLRSSSVYFSPFTSAQIAWRPICHYVVRRLTPHWMGSESHNHTSTHEHTHEHTVDQVYRDHVSTLFYFYDRVSVLYTTSSFISFLLLCWTLTKFFYFSSGIQTRTECI